MAKKRTKKVPYLTHRKIGFTIFATVGVVAVWRGIWIVFDSLPFFEKPLIAGGLAIFIIVVAGIYFKRIDFW